MKTPESTVAHEADYKPAAWHDYTLAELGWWVHLLTKRAGMRDDAEKAQKDIADAQTYLDMMRAMVDDAKAKL